MEEITLIELLITGGTPIGVIAAAWVNMRINVANLKQQIGYLEKELEKETETNKENYRDISTKMDSVFKILSEIKERIAAKGK